MPRTLGNNQGAAALEFALLMPIWLIIFFALIDYGWYLTNLIVMENAVAAGARAGVKVRYWSDEGEDPSQVATQAVVNAFWLPGSPVTNIYIKDADNNPVDMENADYSDYRYLEVRVTGFEYHILTGYLGKKALPQAISAKALMAFP